MQGAQHLIQQCLRSLHALLVTEALPLTLVSGSLLQSYLAPSCWRTALAGHEAT